MWLVKRVWRPSKANTIGTLFTLPQESGHYRAVLGVQSVEMRCKVGRAASYDPLSSPPATDA